MFSADANFISAVAKTISAHAEINSAVAEKVSAVAKNISADAKIISAHAKNVSADAKIIFECFLAAFLTAVFEKFHQGEFVGFVFGVEAFDLSPFLRREFIERYAALVRIDYFRMNI